MKTIRMTRWLIALASAGSIALAPAGCRPQGPSDHESHQHGDEAKTAQITVWGERHEIFAEHRLVVAGTPTKFVTHVTDLQTQEPRRAGPITFALRQTNGPPLVHVEENPVRAGIYEPMLTFPTPGDWNVSVRIPTDDGEKTVDFPPLTAWTTSAHAEQNGEPVSPEGISFLKEQQWKILCKIEPVTKRRLVERIQVPGHALAKPGLSATVSAPLAGQLSLPNHASPPTLGRQVNEGDLIALLQPRFSDAAARLVELEAEFGQAQAVLKQAETAFERTRKLASERAKSERELQEAEAALAIARARYAAASSLRSTYAANASPDSTTPARAVLELRAPITGVITSIGAGIGEPVAAGQAVMTLLNPETIWLKAHVPEAAISRVGETKRALCEVLDGTGRFIAISAEGGRAIFTGLEVDPVTRTIPLVYEMNNAAARLRIGQAVRLHVETARAEETLAVPQSAIVEEETLLVVFVQVSGETFQKRPVKLGIRDGDFVQVLEGLTEGERVATRGAYAIRLSSISSILPAHGHVH